MKKYRTQHYWKSPILLFFSVLIFLSMILLTSLPHTWPILVLSFGIIIYFIAIRNKFIDYYNNIITINNSLISIKGNSNKHFYIHNVKEFGIINHSILSIGVYFKIDKKEFISMTPDAKNIINSLFDLAVEQDYIPKLIDYHKYSNPEEPPSLLKKIKGFKLRNKIKKLDK